MQPLPSSDPVRSLPDASLVRRFATGAPAEAFAVLVGRRFVAVKWAKVDRAAAEAWLAKHGIATSDVPEWDRLTR